MENKDSLPELEMDPVTPVQAETQVGVESKVESDFVDPASTAVEEMRLQDIAIERPVLTTRAPSENVKQRYPHSRPLDPKRRDSEVELTMPSDTEDRIKEALEAIPPGEARESKPFLEFVDVLDEGENLRPDGNLFANTVNREDSMFQQTVDGPAGELGAARPTFRDNEDTKLTGARAVQRAMAYLGQGGVIQIPLWHSGFWITITTPSESELIDLERRIADDKILLGRISNGRVFSNTSVFIGSHVKELVMAKLYDTSLKERELVEELIETHDLQHIAWGLACSVWPSGFKYARSIVGQSETDYRTISEDLNLTKLQWTDVRSLNDWQIKHMANRRGSKMTLEDVKRYRSEFKYNERVVELAPGLSVILAKPSMNEYINSGQRWVNNIVMQNDRVFGMDQDPNARNQYIITHSRSTALRQYGHWVSGIILGGNTDDPIMTKDDRETVETILDKASANDGVREIFFREVPKYIEDTTISVIAIPTVDESEENKFPLFPHLVPIDALTTFFTLLTQKTQQIRARV